METSDVGPAADFRGGYRSLGFHDEGGASPGFSFPRVISLNVCNEPHGSARPPRTGAWTQPCAGPLWRGGASLGLCSASVGGVGLFL